MLIRAISGIIGIGLWLALCFAGHLPFALGVAILAALGIGEFVAAYRRALALEATASNASAEGAARARLNPALAWGGVAFPFLAYRLSAQGSGFQAVYGLLLAAMVGLFAALLLRAARSGKALGGLSDLYGLIGAGYIGALFSSFVLLRGLPGAERIVVRPFGGAERGAWLMLFVAACVWATDTFAFLVGRSVGRHKLAPRLSPGKTLEGALGGVVGALLTGAAFGLWIHLPLAHSLAVGAIAGVIGPIGDLFESALKREIGVKDFGR
ncbi:MAG TPA: phosphatidate cytidylyltransferase, partial [Chthonomonadaceae bacterium]|nr:phosphatidate cytidylyltransferase [Chthonomonadaceae bacterium]